MCVRVCVCACVCVLLVAVVQVRLRVLTPSVTVLLSALLVHTGPVSGGFVSAGPRILRSAQEILALVARWRDR